MWCRTSCSAPRPALSGSALIVDYVLTISISVAAGVDALFSHMPAEFHGIKLWTGTLVLFVLLMLNLRGFRESVGMLAAILGVFLATHAVVLAVALLSNASQIRGIVGGAQESLRSDLADPKIGFVAILFLFLRGYSLGGGTYTGIESVANATNIMRAPVVRTAKRTMLYMSISLAVLAAGILICYVLTGVRPEPGKTLNSVLVDRVVGPWGFLGMPLGHWLAVVTIFSEAILLFLAAQAGFTGGPRVMAGMAVDSWLPHRFAALSERLTMRNGIVLMGFAAFVVYYEMGGASRS